VTLLANEHVGPIASNAGLDFHPLVSNAETQDLYENPNFWHPLKSGFVIARWGRQFVQRQYELLARLASGQDTVLVAGVGILAARLLNEKNDIPLIGVTLQPWTIPSVFAPPQMMGGVGLPPWAPAPFLKLYFRTIDLVGDIVVGRSLNRLRAQLDLKPIRRMFQWWFSPALVLGMFPEWFGPRQADWPAQIKTVGFPMHDGHSQTELPKGLLEFCRAGNPPVAFTFGTGMMHGEGMFRDAVEACRLLKTRALFLTKYRAHLPEKLPRHIRHCEFAPFQKLFPHCAAVVHHGGVGTVAKAFAAGVPQLILPLAFDQMDNGIRVKRLGAGDWLKTKQRSAIQIVNALARLLTPEAKARAESIAARFKGDDALDRAATLVEECGVRNRR
jgi:UDP:flavonoid glycosyltransferase YjiC (YdhE family)